MPHCGMGLWISCGLTAAPHLSRKAAQKQKCRIPAESREPGLIFFLFPIRIGATSAGLCWGEHVCASTPGICSQGSISRTSTIGISPPAKVVRMPHIVGRSSNLCTAQRSSPAGRLRSRSRRGATIRSRPPRPSPPMRRRRALPIPRAAAPSSRITGRVSPPSPPRRSRLRRPRLPRRIWAPCSPAIRMAAKCR